MLSHLLTVHPHGCLPVDRPEVQYDIFAGPVLRDHNASPIPELLTGLHTPLHARQRRLDGKGHQHRTVVLLGGRTVLGSDGVVPQSVEVEPPLAHQLRTGVRPVHG